MGDYDMNKPFRKHPPSQPSSSGNDSTFSGSTLAHSDHDVPQIPALDSAPPLPTAFPSAPAVALEQTGLHGGPGVRDLHDAEKEQMPDSMPSTSAGSSSSSEIEKPKHTPQANEDKTGALESLPEHERQILIRQLETPEVKTSYKTLFRYATRNDIIIMIISAICAIGGGAVMPLMTVVFGQLAGTFQDYFRGTTTGSDFQNELSHFTLYFVYLAIGEFVTIYICTLGFSWTGEHITRKVRENYLKAILRQNIGFFDKLGAGEVTTRITADTNLVQEGISEKISLTLTAIATFVTAFVIGFVKNARLTGILTSSIVAIVLSMGIGSTWMIKWNKTALNSYAVGGTVAEEVLSSIRNAVAFSTQDKLARQYDSYLKTAEKWGTRHKMLLGGLIGTMMCLVYLTYGLAFWQGSRYLVSGSGVTLSDILTILLSIMIGAFSLGNVAPNAQAFTTGAAAAGKIFSTIDRKSPLDPDSTEGKTLSEVQGNVELQNIRHIYPSRPEVVVMEDVNLTVPAGKTTALVGASGSGKSTIVGLVERFYDPVGGEVFLDGINIADLNLRFLRQQISLVSQEPTLFSTTIFGNIAHGLIGTKYEDIPDEKKSELIVDAAKMANAHDFIIGLTEGYDTNVGERGFLLSGGQKQRIAIARAIVSDPKILLLDEATSALDTKSEGIVQQALDKAAVGRTTIIIAHRLSTIKHADNIVVMSDGRIVEQGTHDKLLSIKAAYYNLVEAQQIAAAKRNQDTEEVEIAQDDDENKLDIDRTLSKQSGTGSMLMRRMTTRNSVSAKVLAEKDGDDVKTKYGVWTLIKLVASFNRKEGSVMLFGLFCSIISGAGQPVQAIFFAKSIVALSRPPSQYASLRSDINFYAGMFLMLGIVQLFSHIGHGTAFAFCSERLIRRVRDRSFRTMLRQDIGFFDHDENSPGALTSFLSTQTTQVAGLSGSTLGTILSVLTTLIGSCVLALAIGWKLALVCMATLPILLGCGFFRFWLLHRFQDRHKKAYEKSASYACEATSAIRTVASLTREGDVWEHYHQMLVAQNNKSLRSVSKSAILYAASQSFMFLCIALGFWYGGTLIGNGEYSMLQFFIVYSAVIFGAQSAGTIFSFAPDMGKAKHSAGQLKQLFDRKPEIDTWSTSGETVQTCEGHLEFKDVHFRYPTRPQQPVLRGLDLSIPAGQYIALVGPSGCGKSTTIAMLSRFYNPQSGSITLDGREISDLNILSYRSHLALVSQEPTLYQGTIRENILLGADHPDSVGDAEITKACRDANILSFIQSLPEGFETSVGGKGLLLSGGQKQRVAIARALLRDPKVLLLDEATSALDSESEKVCLYLSSRPLHYALLTRYPGRTRRPRPRSTRPHHHRRRAPSQHHPKS